MEVIETQVNEFNQKEKVLVPAAERALRGFTRLEEDLKESSLRNQSTGIASKSLESPSLLGFILQVGSLSPCVKKTVGRRPRFILSRSATLV